MIDQLPARQWQVLVDAHRAFCDELSEFVRGWNEDSERIVKDGFRSNLRVALAVIRSLPIERAIRLLPELLYYARSVHGHLEEVRETILSIPKEWLIREIERAVDRNRIISFIRFPVRVGEGKASADLDKDMFTRDYDKIWNPQTVKAVVDENPDQMEWAPGALSDNVGCGEVLFSKTRDGQFRITGFDISEYRIAGLSLPDCYRARDFVRQLQGAVACDHRQQVAGMINYPLHFHGQRKTLILHSATDTLRNYDLVFSGSLREALARQQVRNLIGQSDGVATEGGYIWINELSENGEFKIVSIFAP